MKPDLNGRTSITEHIANSAGCDVPLSYVRRGWPVFPLHWPSESGACSCGNALCGSTAKHPITSRGHLDASTEESVVSAWWKQKPSANVGICTGKGSGIVVLDVDGPEGIASLEKLEAEHGALPPTLMATTGKGRHYYFSYPAITVKSRAGIGWRDSKLDVRGDGGYVVAPPSRHASGRIYAWENPDAPLAEAPPWLIDVMTGAGRRTRIDSCPAANDTIPDGERNSALASIAGVLRRKGLSGEAIFHVLLLENRERCNPPLDDSEVRTIADSIARYEPTQEMEDSTLQSLNDVGNARRFVSACQDRFRYVAGQERWIVWDGYRWGYDGTNEVVEAAKRVARGIFHEAADCPSETLLKALSAHAKKSLQRASLASMVELASSDPAMVVLPSALDADPWLMGVANGVLDLRTGTLLSPSSERLMLRTSSVSFDPSATCPNFREFLRTVSNDNQDLMDYVQRVVGYCLTGDTSEQCLFFLYGPGGNGKSTLTRVVLELLGDYGRQAPPEMLSHKSGGRGQFNDLARLQGSRLMLSAEVEEGAFLAETLVKEMTGGDIITARYLYGEFFEFRPQFKILMSGNHKPVVKGDDEGIWRRIRLLPFDHRIPPEKRNRHLGELLRSELPGILNWALEGCLAWRMDGLNAPSVVEEASRDYREEMDILGHWLADCCKLGQSFQCRASLLYDSYCRWTESNGHRPLSATAFGRKMAERLAKGRGAQGVFYQGVQVKTQEELVAAATM